MTRNGSSPRARRSRPSGARDATRVILGRDLRHDEHNAVS